MNLIDKGTVAAIDHDNFSFYVKGIQGRITGVGRRGIGIFIQNQIGGDRRRQSGTKTRFHCVIVGCNIGRYMDCQDGRRAGKPQKHLHAAAEAVVGRGKVGIIGTAAVQGFCPHVVVAFAVVAVVVFLKISGRLGESVAVQDVVYHVVHIEQVGDRGVLVEFGILSQVERKVELKPGASVRRIAGLVVVVLVLVGVHVVAAGEGVFRAGSAVGIVPAEGRGEGQFGVGYQASGAEIGRFKRQGKYVVRAGTGASCMCCRCVAGFFCHKIAVPVARMAGTEVATHGPVVFFQEGARLCVDAHIPPVGAGPHGDIDVPGQANGIAGGDINEINPDGVFRNTAIGKGEPLAAVVVRQEHGCFGNCDIKMRRCRVDGVFGLDGGCCGVGLLRGVRDKATGEINYLAVADRHGAYGIEYIYTRNLLLQIGVGNTGFPVGVLIGDSPVAHIFICEGPFGLCCLQVRCYFCLKLLCAGR